MEGTTLFAINAKTTGNLKEHTTAESVTGASSRYHSDNYPLDGPPLLVGQ